MRRIAGILETIVAVAGRAAAWLFLPLLGLIVLDIVTRAIPGFAFHVWQNALGNAVSSTRLQELQWHVHTVLFSAVLGYAYLRNAQVRLDLWREGRSKTVKLWVEIVGILLFLMPLNIILLLYGWGFVEHSFRTAETSPAVGGVGARFVIKGLLVSGFVLVTLATVAVLLRCLAELLAPRREASFEQAVFPLAARRPEHA
jgi:TRAP-type mannitol/chloroaromatic compound transport system permease small subunit